MRTRSRTSVGTVGRSKISYATQRYWPTSSDLYGLPSYGSSTYSDAIPDSSSVIVDELNLRSSRDRLTRRNQLSRAARRLYTGDELVQVLRGLRNSDFQSHMCEHTQVKVRSLNNFSLVGSSPYFGGLVLTNATFEGNAAVHRYLGSVGSSIANRWTSTTKSYTAESFRTHDWFSMLDKWHEACNSFVPSSSLIGESMVENAIFIDAFKTLLNPTRGVKIILDMVRNSLIKPDTTIGKLRKLTRNSADTYLGYNFGVKPAIDEVVNIFTAHRRVQSRLNFLRQNAGSYIPVRVRHTLPSGISNDTDPSGNSGVGIYCDAKSVTGVISCQAQVRNDLSFSEDWKAYVQHFGLNKFFGLAWELVPFSFVIDWVTNAQEYVNKLTPSLGSPFYNIRGVSHSVKEELDESLRISPTFYHSDWDGKQLNLASPLTVASCKTTTYKRYPRLPTTSGVVDFSTLGTFHFLASGSLLIQKLIK